MTGQHDQDPRPDEHGVHKEGPDTAGATSRPVFSERVRNSDYVELPTQEIPSARETPRETPAEDAIVLVEDEDGTLVSWDEIATLPEVVPEEIPVPEKDRNHLPEHELLELICSRLRGLHLHQDRIVRLEPYMVPNSEGVMYEVLFLEVTQLRFQHSTDLRSTLTFHLRETGTSEVAPEPAIYDNEVESEIELAPEEGRSDA